MIIAGSQPYFIPYIGYWQLINLADVFVIGDDYHYIERGWINRNRILQNGKAAFFNIEIDHASSNKNIGELYLSDKYNSEKKLMQLRTVYRKAPQFEAGFELMRQILEFEGKNLADYLEHSLHCVCDYLGITTKIIRSSAVPGNAELKREYRIFHQCEYFGMDTYINAIGGRELYDYDQFRERGIKLGFLQTGDIQYAQFGQEFIPSLSIIDVIMFNSKEEIREMLNQYTILWEEGNATQSAESEVN